MVAGREARDMAVQRAPECAPSAHELDSACVCARCQATLHDFETTGTRRSILWSELINPNADPGALYLDSNFQPDPDYGCTRTVYQVETTERCRRCGHVRTTAVELAEPDDQGA